MMETFGLVLSTINGVTPADHPTAQSSQMLADRYRITKKASVKWDV